MVHTLIRSALSLTVVAFALNATTVQAQFADLSGQFILEGDLPPMANKVDKGDANAKDAAVCAAEGIPFYPLTVNGDNKGIADVFIYLRRASKVDPKLAAVPEEELVVDQKGCQFLPHSMVVRCNQQVIAKSQDAVPHNIHGINVFNPGFNFTVAANDREGQKVPIDKANAKAEPLPIKVVCDIHSHMESYWLVIDHPYGASSDADGKFTIPGLPVGKHKLTIWHSTCGYVAKTYDVEVKAGGTTLEPIKIKAEPKDNVAKLVPIQ